MEEKTSGYTCAENENVAFPMEQRDAIGLRSHVFPSIETRPSIVEERIRIGDWEGDTVEFKSHKPGINTLVERKTGLVFITKLRERTSAATTDAVVKRFSSLPRDARYMLTTDRGTENS